MVWLRESPDPKHCEVVTKVIVGTKIQWAVMSVPVRFRPAVQILYKGEEAFTTLRSDRNNSLSRSEQRRYIAARIKR